MQEDQDQLSRPLPIDPQLKRRAIIGVLAIALIGAAFYLGTMLPIKKAPDLKPFSIFVCAQGAMGLTDGRAKFVGLPEGSMVPVAFADVKETEASTGCVLLGMVYNTEDQTVYVMPYYGIKP